MKKILIMFNVLLFISIQNSVISQSEPSSLELSSDTIINNIKFKADTIVNFHYKSKSVANGVLAEDTLINGIKYQKESLIEFSLSGFVLKGVNAEDIQSKDLKLKRSFVIPKGSKIFLGERFNGCGFEANQDVMVDKIEFKKNNYVRVDNLEQILTGRLSKSQIINGAEYKENSELTMQGDFVIHGMLNKDLILNGVALKQGHEIYFHRNGKLSSGILAENIKIDGIEYMKNQPIGFNDNGILRNGTLAQSVESTAFKFSKKFVIPICSKIVLRKDGKLSLIEPGQNIFIDGICYKAMFPIQFDQNEQIWYGNVKKSSEIEGIKYKGQVFFYKNGQIDHGIIIEDSLINGVKCKANCFVKFFDNGQLASCILAEDIFIEKYQIKAGGYVYFKKDGTIDNKKRSYYEFEKALNKIDENIRNN